MTGNMLDGAGQVWRLAADFVRDRRRSRRAVAEIQALDSGEAARMLADAGLTRADFGTAMAHPFASEDLLSQAMDSVGIDPDEFAARNPTWLQDLQRSCMMCRVRGRCHQIMSRGEFARRHRDFCPNAADFAQILSARPDETGWRDPQAAMRPGAI